MQYLLGYFQNLLEASNYYEFLPLRQKKDGDKSSKIPIVGKFSVAIIYLLAGFNIEQQNNVSLLLIYISTFSTFS